MDINGYVMDPEKGLCIWLQQRSATKQTWPGKWDNMVCIKNIASSIQIFIIVVRYVIVYKKQTNVSLLKYLAVIPEKFKMC